MIFDRYNAVMEKITYTYPNAQAAEAALMTWASERNVVSQPAVVLLPSYAAIDSFRHAHANDSCLYGLTIATPLEWVGDRWELFGTSARPVTSLERQMMLARLLADRDDASGYQMLAESAGTVALIANMAKEALPFILEVEETDDLSPSERGVCELLHDYASELEARNLTDYPLMLEHLAAVEWPVPDVAILGIEEFSPMERVFFGALSQRAQIRAYSDAYSGAPAMGPAVDFAEGSAMNPAMAAARADELDALQNIMFRPDGTNPVHPTGAVRFLLPAGGYAWPRLLVNQIRACDARSFMVSAKDPERLFSQVATPLKDAGYQVKAEYSVALSKTYVGQLALTLISAHVMDEWSVLAFCDLALNPLVGLSKRRAEQLDAQWRGNRLVKLDEILADLSNSSDDFSAMAQAVATVNAGDVEPFLDACAAVIAQRFEWTEQRRAQEFAACEAMRKQFQVASQVGLSLSAVLDFCRRVSVPVSAVLCSDGTENSLQDSAAKLVHIASLERAAEFAAGSFDVAILSDLDASSYPVKEALSAKDLLFEKIGVDCSGSPLERARRTFFNAMSVARRQLWLARVLKNADAQDLYPAVMLEEVLDCYRRDLTQTTKGLEDKYFGVPTVLVDYVSTAGEDDLYQVLAVRNEDQEWVASCEQLPLGTLSEEHIDYVVPVRKRVGDTTLPLLSPSALESYLTCPYGWFAQRRLRLSHPDRGFSALEMGSFAHGVLQSLHKHLPDHGHARVTPQNLDFAHELLDERFDAHLAFQDELGAYDNPLLPRTELEQLEVQALRRQLHDYLKLDAQLLPDFAPAYLELGFGNKNPFEYAGFALNGSVDRIDVDGQGHAVIIDYKAKAGTNYQLKNEAPLAWADGIMLPQRVQALMYAQAVRKTLGLQVVGALYVSYGKTGMINGAIDPIYLGPLDVPGLNVDKCKCEGSFHDYLDQVEDLVSQAVQRLLAGEIRPEPRGGNPCAYCPVSSCDRRV